MTFSRHLACVVVLAGAAGRLANLRSALNRNLFELPGANQKCLLDGWLDRFQPLVSERAEPLPTILAIDRNAPEPSFRLPGSTLAFKVVRDDEMTRGTAGILRDLTRALSDDDDVLVVTASDLGWEWNDHEGRELLERPEDVVISADADLRPAGPLRIRCGLLKRVPSVGFVDLKEQFLPRCRDSATVFVNQSDRRMHGSLRDLRSYLGLARGAGADATLDAPDSAEPWRPRGSLVEPGAEVAPSAMLFDSVVLAKATIKPGAVVVRSLIGPGAIVSNGSEIVDKVLVGNGKRGLTQEVAW